MSAEPQWASQPSEVYWSADGQWWWDGYTWRPRAHHPAVYVPVAKKNAFDASVESIKSESNRWVKAGLVAVVWLAAVEFLVVLIPAGFHPGLIVGVLLSLVLEASFGLVPILALHRFGMKEKWREILHLGRLFPSDLWRVPAWLVISYFAAGVLLVAAASVFPALQHQFHSNNPLAGVHSLPLILYGYVQGVLIAPVAEEVMCRGLLLRAFSAKWGFGRGAIFSSVIFGLAHAYEEPTLLSGLVLTLGIGTIGFMMCLLVRHTNRLSSSIAMHALMNTIALTIGFMT